MQFLSHINLFTDFQKKDCFITYEPVYWFAKKDCFLCHKDISHVWKFSCIFKWKFHIRDRENSWVNCLCIKSKPIFNVLYCFTNFTGIQHKNSHDQECKIFRVVLLYEHKHIENFQICSSASLSINHNLIIKSYIAKIIFSVRLVLVITRTQHPRLHFLRIIRSEYFFF